jgi:hypothetical protein
MPYEVSHSAMKPLSQETSHRTGLIINLFGAQRVVWGAYVDLSKVVRPMRAKNLTKMLKYMSEEDRFPNPSMKEGSTLRVKSRLL